VVRIPLSPQKETHNESCGFFVFTNKPSLLELVRGNKKPNHAILRGCGFYVCIGYPIGINEVNPSIIRSLLQF